MKERKEGKKQRRKDLQAHFLALLRRAYLSGKWSKEGRKEGEDRKEGQQQEGVRVK
jgi:hypothetical protein